MTAGELVGSRRRLRLSSFALPPASLVRVTGADTALNTAFALAELGFSPEEVAETGYALTGAGAALLPLSPASGAVHYVGPHFRWEVSGFWPTVREEIALGGQALGDAAVRDRVQAGEIFRALGLVPLLERHPQRLSGGETAKVVLAAHLVHAPRALALDRVLAELDRPTRQHVLAQLPTWVPQATFVIDEGLEGRFDALVSTDGDAAEWRKGLGESAGRGVPPSDTALTLRVIGTEDRAPNGSLELLGFTVLRDGREVFPPQDLAARNGDLVLVQGPNGCGKTTLLEGIAGLLEGRGGVVVKRAAKTTAPGCAFALSPQDPLADITEVDARRELALASGGAGPLAAALAELDFPAELLRAPLHEDVGLRKLTSVVAATLRGRPVCLLDEPTIYLGRALKPVALRAIRRYLERGGIVLCSTHDEDLIDQLGG